MAPPIHAGWKSACPPAPSPWQVAEELDEANIYVWDENYYALGVTERLGLEESGGMVWVGPVHYTTTEVIDRFGEVLGRIAEVTLNHPR
jgi:selenocysteine lyase/cysteine desulfurase